MAFDGKLPRVTIGCIRVSVTGDDQGKEEERNELGTNATIAPNVTSSSGRGKGAGTRRMRSSPTFTTEPRVGKGDMKQGGLGVVFQ